MKVERPLWRVAVVVGVALAVALPLSLVIYQSFLSAPFFQPTAKGSFDAYTFVFSDKDFWTALRNTVFVATGMTAIAVPLGGILAFLMIRTDLPGRSWIEPLLLSPVFVSPMVLAFGYVVALGPVGFVSLAAKSIFGDVPWTIYSLPAIAVVAGLTHIPHVYLYASSALSSLGSDVEEAARVAGAGPLTVMRRVSLPMIAPALLFAGVLVFFLGFEMFALPLILGDPEGILVLTSYLYKLTNRFGVPSYQLMAVVVVAILAISLPLVLLQRRLLRDAERYVTLKGKGARSKPLPLGKSRWIAFAGVVLWLLVAVGIPLAGIGLRSVVSAWGEGINITEVLTLDHFYEVFDYPPLVHGIVNTILIATIGGAASVAVYALIALSVHRWPHPLARIVDYAVLIPRAMPGLIAGLAMLWVFLFFAPLRPLKSTLVSLWIAYTLVWLAYGMRLISASLLQVGRELEEAGKVAGASTGRVNREITIPLIRFGLMSSWVLIFMIFVREYSTGIYLLGPGTEVTGAQLISLWGTGAADVVSALSVINVATLAVGLAIALRLGVRLR
ncbi:ABC transporter permease [Roseiterribacter gracilis]|uniref:ABC transporter permease n=1 Tax=Roseiterribacter gracilis TaxID=2812848 RepID=A0A8S8XGN2_9PROT|nr:ABC transporter permease [Rhodospirillales bacterium TMPK1]